MKTLILETSTEKSCLILADLGRPVRVKNLNGGPELSKRLAMEVNDLLSFQPELIAVGIGPGSYTGIRVGAALAKALSFAWKIPLTGFCSLKAFLPSLEKEPYAVIVDARMGGLYVLFSGKDIPELVPPTDPRLQEIPHLFSPHPEVLKKRGILAHETSPDPASLSKLVFNQFLESGISSIELNYLSSP